MSKSLIDFIWEQDSYSGTVDVPITKTYRDPDGLEVPVVLKMRRPGSVELLSYQSIAGNPSPGAIAETTAALAANLLEDPDLSDARVLAKFDAKTPLEALSRWLDYKDLMTVVSRVSELVAESNQRFKKEHEDAKNS